MTDAGMELAERLLRVATSFAVARLEALAELPGNPLGLEVRRFGRVVAPAAVAAPDLDFVNRIEGVGSGDVAQLGAALDFYATRGARPWLELAPYVNVEIEGAVEFEGVHAVFVGPAVAGEPGVRVREVEPAEAASLLLEGLGVPPAIVPRHAPPLGVAVERVRGRVLVADVAGEAAAAAILIVEEGLGFLALASTLPRFRGRGCQSALITARIAAAAEAGCELVTSGAALGSQSQRNLERAGLRVVYTKPVLRLTPRRAVGGAPSGTA